MAKSTGMTQLTPPSTAPRPALVPDPAAPPLSPQWARDTEARLATLEARLVAAETRLAAMTPESVLQGIEAQISAARANLAENLKWMELSTRMLSKARQMFEDLGLDNQLDSVNGAIPNPAAALQALAQRPRADAGATAPTGAGADPVEAMLSSLASKMGINL